MEEAYIGCGQCCFPCTPRSGLTKTKTKCILQGFPDQAQLYKRNGSKTVSKSKGTQALLSALTQFLFNSFLVSFFAASNHIRLSCIFYTNTIYDGTCWNKWLYEIYLYGV